MALKKWIALIAAIMMVAGCFAACSSAPAQEAATAEPQATQEAASAAPEATAEPITLVFWHTYGDGEEEQFKNVVLPMWNELHPEITIEAVRQDGSQYHEMIVTSFGTGQSPDVARIDIVNTAAYASQGGLAALSDYEDFAALKDTFLEGPLSTNLYQGSYYGLPLDTNCKAAVINTAFMKELGIEGAPATMEEFIAAAETRGTYSLNVSGVGDWDLYPYFWLFGGTLTDEGFTKASGYLDSAASVAAIQTLLDLHAKKVLTIRDVDGSTDAWDGINSEYAMFFEGPWFFGSYEEKLSQGIIAATIPTYNGRSASVVGGENIAVFATSKHVDAAYEFAKFMTSEPVQLAMLEKGQLPVLKSLVNNETVLSNPVWSVYLYKGGRCSGLEMYGARVFQIKPCIEVINGKMIVGKKYNGSFKRCLEQYIKDKLKDKQDIDYSRVFITHPMCSAEIVDDVKATIAKLAHFDEVVETPAGCTISSHCGPNTLGILFLRTGNKCENG